MSTTKWFKKLELDSLDIIGKDIDIQLTSIKRWTDALSQTLLAWNAPPTFTGSEEFLRARLNTAIDIIELLSAKVKGRLAFLVTQNNNDWFIIKNEANVEKLLITFPRSCVQRKIVAYPILLEGDYTKQSIFISELNLQRECSVTRLDGIFTNEGMSIEQSGLSEREFVYGISTSKTKADELALKEYLSRIEQFKEYNK